MARPNNMTNPMRMFTEIEVNTEDKNYFPLGHQVMYTAQVGELMPIAAIPVLPGDTINLDFISIVKLPPLIAPINHQIEAQVWAFFVPYRIIWEGWDEWVAQLDNAGTIPMFNIDGSITAQGERFLDTMGICPPWSSSPAQVETEVWALPAYAYQKIYDEYFRAQQLIAPQDLLIPLAGGTLSDANRDAICVTRQLAWEHDYFTSALPEPQIGDPVSMPLSTVELLPNWNALGLQPAFESAAGVKVEGDVMNSGAVFTDEVWVDGPITDSQVGFNPDGSLVAGDTTINQLREKFALQRFMEKLNRGGQRYPEYMKVIWGVTPSDARLQIPEYITGLRAPVIIQEILNTAGVVDGTQQAQGYQSGHAISIGYGDKSSYTSEEHGVIIVLQGVRPKPAYMQGIPREWTKTDAWELGTPDFQHIGEQAIKVRELYAFGNDQNDDFGYIPRFSEYKYMPSRIAGEFRTDLDFYQLARNFAATPVLNQEFIEVPQSIADHIFVTSSYTNDPLWIATQINVGANRKLAFYSTPI